MSLTSLLEEKFTVGKFERRRDAFFEKFDGEFMPFAQKNPLPDPELLVPHQIEEVQELIDLVKEGDLVSFVVSNIGMGKTALCRFLAETLPQEEDQKIVSVFLHGPSIENREQMLRVILDRLELQAEGDDVASEFERLRQWHEDYSDFLLVVIVDEFPDISEDALGVVRSAADLEGVVWVLNGCKGNLIDYVEEKAPALMERKRHTFELDSMSEDEIKELLIFRMAWARDGDYDDREIEPFTKEAIESIYEKSGGVPRKALKLAGDSVYNAIEEDETEIGPDLVYERDEEEEAKGFWSFIPFLGED